MGESYTEDVITERIKGKCPVRTTKPERKGISLLIDIENSIKAQQSAGYERWAKIENLKRAAKTMNFLTEHGIREYARLETKVADLVAASDETAAALKGVEKRFADMAVITACLNARLSAGKI